MTMRKVFFHLIIILSFFVLGKDARAENLANCAHFSLSMNVTGQLPSGGTLQVSCPGDTGTSGCVGHTNASWPISNGSSLALDKCSCWGASCAALNIPNGPLTSYVAAGCQVSWSDGDLCTPNQTTKSSVLNISCPVADTCTNNSATPRTQCQQSSCVPGWSPSTAGTCPKSCCLL